MMLVVIPRDGPLKLETSMVTGADINDTLKSGIMTRPGNGGFYHSCHSGASAFRASVSTCMYACICVLAVGFPVNFPWPSISIHLNFLRRAIDITQFY